MDQKLIITRRKEQIVTALYEDQKLAEINLESIKRQSILGNIYTAKVKNVVKNINAAFVEISENQLCYYSLSDNHDHIFLNEKKNTNVVAGDELLVQISKENIKTKAPVASCYLNLSGKYMVLSTKESQIGISNKIIGQSERERLKNLVKPYLSPGLGWIVRTNARNAKAEQIVEEAQTLQTKLAALLDHAQYRTCFQLLYETPADYLVQLKNQSALLTEIVTDDGPLYQEIMDYLSLYQPEDLPKVRLYEDTMVSLSTLYRLEKGLEDALKERVWLASGAYLIIQPTEAMIVIDVNTGKALNKKNMQEHFLSINLEAAREIARQIRLRNLSGIIIIDFINMESTEDIATLMSTLEEAIQLDRIKTTLVDITKLNLVELTRKKMKKPLYEQINFID